MRPSPARRSSDLRRRGGTANATRLDLDGWRDGIKRGLQKLCRRFDMLLGNDLLECTVDDLLGDGFLAVLHHHVDELGDELALELGIGKNLTDFRLATTGHG